MSNKKRKNVSVAEKDEFFKQFTQFHGSNVVLSEMQEISVPTQQSIVQKKDGIGKH